MKKNNAYLLTIFGLILLVIGLILIKTNILTSSFSLAIPYLLVGIGCGMFGHGFGKIIEIKTTANNPELLKEIEIEQNDERNIEIMNKAKAKAYDAMTFIFAALLLAISPMNIPLQVILLIAISYLIIIGVSIYYRIKYNKEM